MLATAEPRMDDLPLEPPDQILRPVMLQRWSDLTFISWPFDPETVQGLLPEGLEVDTFDGHAWVSILPFRLSVRLPGLPTVPWASSFPEVNVRTYVVGPDGRRAIWFLSLDATRLGAVWVARKSYRLPYVWAAATVEVRPDSVVYRGQRRWPRSGGDTRWHFQVDIGGPIENIGALDRFLTARWRVYSPLPLGLPARKIAFVSTTVEHPPWPLRHARLAEAGATLMTAAGLPSTTGAPVVAYSPGVSVRFDSRRKVLAQPSADSANSTGGMSGGAGAPSKTISPSTASTMIV